MAVNTKNLVPLTTHITPNQDQFIRQVIQERKTKNPTFSKGDLIREIISRFQQEELGEIHPQINPEQVKEKIQALEEIIQTMKKELKF